MKPQRLASFNSKKKSIRTFVAFIISCPLAIVRVEVTCLTRDLTAKVYCGRLGLCQYWSDHCLFDTQGCGVSHMTAGINLAQFAS